MFRSVETGPQVVVCDTCRGPVATRDDHPGQRGGALLLAALREARDADPALAGVGIEEMSCLFACARSCAVHIRAPGKISYVLGDFAPTREVAQAILEWTALYAAGEDGKVPYSQWPEAVKGHFVTRMPPQGFVVA